ncbi:MAG: allophanate hydrolase [Gammaproteobacteria bacterium]|uniref:allophanate hydrolase n=1 Tax=Hydrogenophaga sp. TaxID=1904254 RepID=UPI0025C262A2|nr:allophanate hydrolase [Hydrogenophaga sp.]MBU4183661.1 allophanate hydrolase [Gammaproteobacteria bacterium]MBU4281171.1 allophanate hydrolase [Gammaproteobacteria bacterium]MBU4321703.1 allophanate hydrolase [Gammaproteobacteria bacterium]MBU4507847.1 allophanate hydrolase [Gammaproteobacteria bacterium]MCG2655551.1 allophanate hydrolase [Hydrogenophaga sp.]
MNLSTLSFDIASLQAAYASGVTVRAVVAEAQRRCASDTHHAFIHRLSDAEIEPFLAHLDGVDPASLPLYGVPFAIKDNIDLAHIPTTAGCPEFAYTPGESAFLIQQLVAAGAVPLGKTNLDQFATGLNGTRSPYGACQNAFNPEFVSGGSSSGSAVSVAKGWVTFSLGTDTAGSGRVPASINNLIGLKPSIGLLSGTGVVPACRSVDTVSIFALTAADAQAVLAVAAAYDEADAFSRKAEPFGVDFSAGPFRFGVPRAQDLAFFGNTTAPALFEASVERLKALGGTPVTVDLTPFLEAARLLYEGPWVAERYVAIQDFIDAQPEAVFPPVRTIIEGGRNKTAADAFAASYRLKALKRVCDAVWKDVDCLLTPTAGTIYRIAEMQADPIRLNSNLGYYTNFMNLLDYSAVAVPAGMLTSGDAAGLPWGVTLGAPAHKDVPLLRLADRFHRAQALSLGATATPLADTPAIGDVPKSALGAGSVKVAVCGAHLSGLPLNWQLTQRGAHLLGAVKSAAEYRFYALAGGPVQRPGMVRVAEGGAAIDMEVWEMPAQHFGSFVDGIPAPLGIGKVKLANGSWVSGFVCEAIGVEGGTDITALGSWRAWLAQKG